MVIVDEDVAIEDGVIPAAHLKRASAIDLVENMMVGIFLVV